MNETTIETLFECLINGDRCATRRVIDAQFDRGCSGEVVLTELFWPTYEMVDRLFREDQLTSLSYNFATRLLRTHIDQIAAMLPRKDRIGRTVLAMCGHTEADELAAQMSVDLLESYGFEVRFGGSGIARDEILSQVHESKPHVLLLFASAACDLPDIRLLIDTMQEIGAADDTQIVVGGGVFNRANGLAEEIGADLWATDPLDLVDIMAECPTQRATPDQRTVGRKRMSRKAA